MQDTRMPYLLYSYRLKRRLPLLSESEWQTVATKLGTNGKSIIEYRKKNQCSLTEAIEAVNADAIAAYHELAGVRLKSYQELYAVRLSNYGRLCPNCERPFRTPRARFCAECGYELPNGQLAGKATYSELSHLEVNVQKFEIQRGGLILGLSRLEFGDAPMGIAEGTFLPTSYFSDFRIAESPIEDGDQRRWLDCVMYDQSGNKIEGASAVITEIGESGAPIALQVTCRVSYPEYEELFPHHVESYKSAFE